MRFLTSFFVLWMACRSHETVAVARPHDVRCVAAEARTAHDELTLRGAVVVRPDQDAVIAAEVSGRILSIHVREGDAVHAGDRVAEIECGPRVDAAKQARAALDSANAVLAEATSSRAREAHLVERGIAARQVLETATAREAAARSAVESERARVDDAELAVSHCSVRSSQTGIAIHVLRRRGDIVDGTSATAIAEIANPDAAEIILTATANELSRLTPGQKARIELASQPGTPTDGVVLAAPPSVDRATGLGAVRVSVLGKTKPVLGALVTAVIDLGTEHAVIALPRAAVRSAGGVESEVVSCGTATAKVRAVKVGDALEGGFVAVEGLAVGDRVVADGALGLEDGSEIREVSP